MVIVWLIIEALFLCLFFSLPTLIESSAPESSPLVTEKSSLVTKKLAINDSQSHGQEAVSWSMRMWNILREEIVVLLAVLFVVMFNQTAVEVKFCTIIILGLMVYLLQTMCVPMAQNLLKWKEEDISVFYSVAGVVVRYKLSVVSFICG